MNKLILCVAGYNEADTLPYSIGSVYDEVDEIIFVEGAVENRFPTPHSTDDTLEVVKGLDKDNKIDVVRKPGDEYWKSLEEQKDVFTRRITPGDWLVICDADEVYMEGDLTKLRKIMPALQYKEYIPLFVEFYKDFKHILRPQTGIVNLTNQRVVQMVPGGHYSCHHPTMCIDGHKDSSIDEVYRDRRTIVPDFLIFHLSWTRSREFMIGKHAYYAEKFENMSHEDALAKATAKVDEEKDVMSYDGQLPAILKTHPLYNRGNVKGAYPNWKTCLEYKKPELVESPYNIKWKTPSKISVVITCYNNLDVLKVTLPRWKRQTYKNYEIVVVDDGSKNSKEIEEFVTGLGYKYFFQEDDGYRIASARNLGVWNSTGDRILFTDSDIIPHDNLLIEHIASSDDNTIVVGPRSHILSTGDITRYTKGDIKPVDVVAKDKRIEGAFESIRQNRCLDPWEHVHGCNFSVDRPALMRVNGFDEEFDGKWGAEDVDLAFRLIRSNIAVVPNDDAIVYHIDHEKRTTGGQRELLKKKMTEQVVRGRPRSWTN